MGKIKDLDRWRSEIILSEEFRRQEFGAYTRKEIIRAGENIDYFEKGFTTGFIEHDTTGEYYHEFTATLNLVHALIKNVVPALYYQNPRVLAFPKRKVDQDASVFAGEILNYYYKNIDADKHNRKIIFDSYLLGMGIYKIGYATKFGVDIPDKQKKKSRTDRVLESIGLKKPKEEVATRPEVSKEIIAESPYVQWISPFNFLIDPRASCLDDAMWCAHVIEKTVEDLKSNPKFKNTSGLQGTQPDFKRDSDMQIPQTQLEAFQTVKLYEIHYRSEDGFYLLYIAKDGPVFRELYHEKSVYNMDEWQFDILNFSGHTHKLYQRSEVTKMKSLQDRLTGTIDSILEQVDSFVPKIGVDQTKLSTAAKESLEDGDIGTIVYFDGDPATAVREIALTQFKADLRALMEEIINIVTIQTGVTKAQLTGVATGETATAETIAQGGQTLRLNDMTSEINRFSAKQATKLWKIVRQFVDLPSLELITGESGVNPETGMVNYTWLPEITDEVDERLQSGMFRFDVEVGSTQKANTPVIIKRVEDLLNILARMM